MIAAPRCPASGESRCALPRATFVIGPLPALAPSDEVGLVLQFASVGALFGAAVAAVFRSRDPDADTWLLTVAITLLFAAIGLLLVGMHRLG